MLFTLSFIFFVGVFCRLYREILELRLAGLIARSCTHFITLSRSLEEKILRLTQYLSYHKSKTKITKIEQLHDPLAKSFKAYYL